MTCDVVRLATNCLMSDALRYGISPKHYKYKVYRLYCTLRDGPIGHRPSSSHNSLILDNVAMVHR